MILGLGNFEFRAIIKIIFGGHFFQKIFESDTDSFYVVVVAIFQGIHLSSIRLAVSLPFHQFD